LIVGHDETGMAVSKTILNFNGDITISDKDQFIEINEPYRITVNSCHIELPKNVLKPRLDRPYFRVKERY